MNYIEKGKIMQDTSFSGSANLNKFINDNIVEGGGILKENHPMQYFNRQVAQNFNPDINGYSLCFMVPPPFISLREVSKYQYSYVELFRKLTVFSSVQFNPPTRQVQTEKLAARTGGIPYATEVEPSEQCSVSYIDNTDLDIFNYHCAWLDAINDLVLGYVKPSSIYLSGSEYGGLDYAGSLFVVRYDNSMQNILYVGKVTGIYPQSLPNKEIIGQRTNNEISTIPITYFAGWYEETTNLHHPIWKELEDMVISYYG